MIILLLIVVVVLIVVVYYKSLVVRGERLSDQVYAAALKASTTDKVVEVPNANVWSATRFFDVYASTEKKYVSLPGKPGYAGYVRLGDDETIVVALRHSKGLSIVTHEPPWQFGDDAISSATKVKFFDEVMTIYSAMQY